MHQSSDQAIPIPPTFGWWRVWLDSFFRPGAGRFRNLAADPRAGMMRAFAWAFLGSLGTTTAAVALLLITGSIAGLELLKDPAALPGGWSVPVIAALLLPLAAAGGIISLLTDSLITQLTARILGGRGRFSRLVYCKSTYLVPAALTSTLVSFIPAVGVAAILVELYATFLDAVAVKAVHSFSWSRAAAAAFIPFVLSLGFKAALFGIALFILFLAGRDGMDVFTMLAGSYP